MTPLAISEPRTRVPSAPRAGLDFLPGTAGLLEESGGLREPISPLHRMGWERTVFEKRIGGQSCVEETGRERRRWC